jgi:uncharacterized protein YbjT (DUF2867 family)
MRVLLPGIAGFVGKGLLDELLGRGHEVIGIVRSESDLARLPRSGQLQVVYGDVSAPARLSEALPSSFDACIYLPGLLREFPAKGITFQQVHVEGVRNLLKLAKDRGATRWLQMSALGVGRGYSTKYYQTKLEAETLVKQSGLDWTIFRPSVMFSEEYDPRLNFVSELGKVVRMAPVIPIFGDGKYRMQPVALSVLAKAMVDSLSNAETNGKTYEVGGPDQLQYRQILQTIARAQGKKKPMISVPFGLMKGVASLLDRFPFFPVTRDQLTMLEHENIVRDPKLEREFNATFNPKRITFAEGVQRYYATKP